MSGLPRSADVVVVGGGAIGTSIAFHLAEAGVAVCLLERDALASGSTSRAAGGVRAQFSDPLNVAIGLRGIEAFARFSERPGGAIDFRQVGYLFLLDRPEDVVIFERSVELQNELGVPSRLVGPEEAARLSPLAGLEGVLAATFCPIDGHASPEAVTQGYAAGARRHGAAIVVGVEALAIDVAAGRVRGVATDHGTVSAEAVVCAAGVWSPALARTAGVELPVEPVLREVYTTEPIPDLRSEIPLTVDFTTGFYFHREGPGLLFGMADRSQAPGFDRPTDPTWLERVSEVAGRRAPMLLDVGVAHTWKGYYEVTPDHNGLVGEARQVERLYYATGFSGHGFMQAPAVGEIIRDLVLGREPFLDVSPLSVERFAMATQRPEHNVI
ncbi:MAG: FAD-dependent oxidoreductase [Gaiellaceae bacterium]|nr:MAG: FAD-dependent oxidoreductase [Gaiellaceae bacterium]